MLRIRTSLYKQAILHVKVEVHYYKVLGQNMPREDTVMAYPYLDLAEEYLPARTLNVYNLLKCRLKPKIEGFFLKFIRKQFAKTRPCSSNFGVTMATIFRQAAIFH